MGQTVIMVAIIGMCVVTYIPRALPMLMLASRSMPPLVTEWLSFIPAAVLAALLLPSLVMQEGSIALGVDNVFLWAGIPAFILAITTRSFFGTVALGMGIVAACRFFF